MWTIVGNVFACVLILLLVLFALAALFLALGWLIYGALVLYDILSEMKADRKAAETRRKNE